MKISVILPCYNVERFIRNGLDSIIAQSYKNWEAILVDDGATDDTGNIVDEYVTRDSRFIAIHTNNQGVSAARNEGLLNASGNLIYFMDPDDEIDTLCFQKCIETFQKYKPDIVHFNRKRIKNGIEKKDEFFPFEIVEKNAILKDYTAGLIGLSQNALNQYYRGKKIFHFKKNWQIWAFMIKKELILNNGMRFHNDLRMFEDAMFLAELMTFAKKIVRISDVLYTYYIRDTGALNSRTNDCSKIFEDKYKLIKYRAALRRKIDDFDLHDFYIGSQVFSCLQLLVQLSKSKENGRLCNAYINTPEVQESIQKVDIEKAPLKFKLPVFLLKQRKEHFLFILCSIARKIGLFKKLVF